MSNIRTDKLISNTLLLGISEFSSKLLFLIMVPFYTRTLSTIEYGIIDMITTTVVLLLPLFTLKIAASVFRFSIERPRDVISILNIGLRVIILGFVILLFCYPLIKVSNSFNGYESCFYLFYFANALDGLNVELLRGLNKYRLLSILGILKTVLIITGNLLLLLWFHYGIVGYIISYSLAMLFCTIISYIVIHSEIYLTLRHYNSNGYKEMIKYSLPLIPNDACWWLVNSANRYIIKNIVGLSSLGLFSVASKIPSIITMLQSIFTSATSASVVNCFDNNRDDEYFKKIYKYYNVMLTCSCSLIILFTRLIVKILFAKEYYDCWKFIPFLLISSIFGGLSGYLGCFYNAKKNNTGIGISTLIGAIISITMSVITVKYFGVLGITIVNSIAYIFIWLYRYYDIGIKQLGIHFNSISDYIGWLILIVQAIFLLIPNSHNFTFINIFLFTILIIMYRKHIFSFTKIILQFMVSYIKRTPNKGGE